MVISLKSFLEDFVTITWIVHAVQRRAKKNKIKRPKKKPNKKNPSRIDHRLTHTKVGVLPCVMFECVIEGETDNE